MLLIAHRPPRGLCGPGYSEGVLHQEKGNYDEAVSCYNKYLQENPKGPLRETVLCQIGKCYEATGNADQAVAYYQKVIDTSTEGIWADLPKQGLSRLKEER